MARPEPHRRADYPHSRVITTRWMDSDPYGHMNNVVHYEIFDTVVNAWLIEHGALDIQQSPVIGLVVETGCQYFAPLTYPEPVTAALRVAHVGRSSVRYEIGALRQGSSRPPRRATSCTCTSIARRAARVELPRRCARRSSRCVRIRRRSHEIRRSLSPRRSRLRCATPDAQAPGIKRTILQRTDVGGNGGGPGPGRDRARRRHRPPHPLRRGDRLRDRGNGHDGDRRRAADRDEGGDSYLIPAGKIHDARNTGDAPVKVLATYVVEKGKPLATPAN